MTDRNPGLSPDMARMALAFLRRVQLTGDEVDAFLQLRMALDAVAAGSSAPAFTDGGKSASESRG